MFALKLKHNCHNSTVIKVLYETKHMSRVKLREDVDITQGKYKVTDAYPVLVNGTVIEVLLIFKKKHHNAS